MSRRRGEFEHRTSIFEGAYRAWSHLGGCQPDELLSLPASDLDPLIHPHDPQTDLVRKRNSSREAVGDEKEKSAPGAEEDEKEEEEEEEQEEALCYYPYEALPRIGIAHSFVQAIITPWLGPDADQDDIHHGLTTLRTWWQHRRNGESVSAKAALGAPQMKGVVDGYMRHFFNLAHYIVLNNGEQPPKSLMERLRTARHRQQVAERSAEHTNNAGQQEDSSTSTEIQQEMCAGSVDDGDEEEKGTKQTTGESANEVNETAKQQGGEEMKENEDSTYGDPNSFPIVCTCYMGRCYIAFDIPADDSCYHCKKIIEIMLQGVHGIGPPPIRGLLNAIASNDSSSILVKIDGMSSAKRVSHEISKMLKLAGYEIEMKEIKVDKIVSQLKSKVGLNNHQDLTLKSATEMVIDAFEQIYESKNSKKLEIRWDKKCMCPDSRVLDTCPRHVQITKRAVFEAFDIRRRQTLDFLFSGSIPTEEECYEAIQEEWANKRQKTNHGNIAENVNSALLEGGTAAAWTPRMCHSSSSPPRLTWNKKANPASSTTTRNAQTLSGNNGGASPQSTADTQYAPPPYGHNGQQQRQQQQFYFQRGVHYPPPPSSSRGDHANPDGAQMMYQATLNNGGEREEAEQLNNYQRRTGGPYNPTAQQQQQEQQQQQQQQ